MRDELPLGDFLDMRHGFPLVEFLFPMIEFLDRPNELINFTDRPNEPPEINFLESPQEPPL